MVRSYLVLKTLKVLNSLGGLLVLLDILVFRRRPQDLLDLPKFQQRMFGQFWLKMGAFLHFETRKRFYQKTFC